MSSLLPLHPLAINDPTFFYLKTALLFFQQPTLPFQFTARAQRAWGRILIINYSFLDLTNPSKFVNFGDVVDYVELRPPHLSSAV